MTNEEINDLQKYFRLVQYRDVYQDILLDEWDELEDIIKRNIMAQDIEAARFLWLKKQFTEEEYKATYNEYYIKLLDAIKERDNNQEKTKKLEI